MTVSEENSSEEKRFVNSESTGANSTVKPKRAKFSTQENVSNANGNRTTKTTHSNKIISSGGYAQKDKPADNAPVVHQTGGTAQTQKPVNVKSSLPNHQRQVYYAINEDNEIIGTVDKEGIVRDEKENILGEALSNNTIVDLDRKVIGRRVEAIVVYDGQGNVVSRKTLDGTEIKDQGKQKLSFGYGHLHQTAALAFASEMNIVTGETEEGVLIINDDMGEEKSLAEVCNLNYKTAAEEGRLTGCLEDLNAIRMASDTEDEKIAQKIKKYGVDKEEARTLLENDYMNDLAARYLEALNIYNESLDFKNAQVDPIMTAHIKENTNAIKMVK